MRRPDDVLDAADPVALRVPIGGRARREVHGDSCVRPAVIQGVPAVAADEPVVAGPADEPVVVGAAPEDVVAVAAGQRVVAGVADEHVVAVAAGQDVVAAAAPKRVVSAAAGEPVVAGAALQPVRGAVAGHRVVARPGDEVLDRRAAGDGEVAGQSQDVRDRFRAQVDPLVPGVGAQIDGVDAAGVENGERDRLAGVEVGVLPLAGQVREEPAEVAADVGAGPVDGVARVRGGGRAVQVPDRDDVRDHRRHRQGQVGVGPGVVGLAEVRHHRRLPGVVQEPVVDAVLGDEVVVSGVRETDGMADLVEVGVEGEAVYRRAEQVDPVRRDVDVRAGEPAVGAVPGHRERPFLVVAERDPGSAVHEPEVDADHAGPGFERPAGQLSTLAVQGRHVDGQLPARRDVEGVLRQAHPFPSVVGELPGDFVVAGGVSGDAAGIGHPELVAARVVAGYGDVPGAGRRRGEREARVPDAGGGIDVVVEGDGDAGGVVQQQNGVFDLRAPAAGEVDPVGRPGGHVDPDHVAGEVVRFDEEVAVGQRATERVPDLHFVRGVEVGRRVARFFDGRHAAAARRQGSYSTARATSSPSWSRSLTATTTYCLPSCRYVIGAPDAPAGSSVCHSTRPVALS